MLSNLKGLVRYTRFIFLGVVCYWMFIEVLPFSYIRTGWVSGTEGIDYWIITSYEILIIPPSYHWINWIIDNSPSFWVVDNDFCVTYFFWSPTTNLKVSRKCRVLIFVSKPPRSHTIFTASAWRLRVHHLDCDPWAILSVFSVKNTCFRETRDKGLYEQWKKLGCLDYIDLHSGLYYPVIRGL